MKATFHAAALVGLMLIAGCHSSSSGPGAAPSNATPTTDKQDTTTADGKKVEIDLDKAIEISMPEIKDDLKPVAFKTPDGKSGWVLRIPGNRPIATPAYADGLIFVGGGYGSHEFYAFDAKTGAKVWQMQTGDDGPTAAVVEDGLVAFNTESCTVIVAEALTGKIVWQEWLGDPLMSQPAIWKGRLYMAYPAGQKGNKAAGHQLLCADLKTGKHLWEQQITGDVISAPIIDDDRVFFTCFDGTSFCVKAEDGTVVWKKQNAGTSAPVVAAGQVVVTEKTAREGKEFEGMRRLDVAKGESKDAKLLTEREAQYLKQGGGAKLAEGHQKSLDAGVGFASAPQTANLGAAQSNVGVQTVAGAWAYEGSRAACYGGQIMNAQGNMLNCVDARDGRFAWRGEARGKSVASGAQIFSPPALGSRNMFLCSAQGHLLSVAQKDGAVGFVYSTKQPMVFQPALVGGCMYAGTASGLVICLDTGDKDCDGWTMWGGNAQHNKKETGDRR